MIRTGMKFSFAMNIITCGLLLNGCGAHAQGVFYRTVTFDGYPKIAPEDSISTSYYYEDSVTFRPILPDTKFGRDGGESEFAPWNGTAFLDFPFTSTMLGTRGGWSRFGLFSVDLAEYSTVVGAPRDIEFIGLRFDSTRVTNTFRTDGTIDGPEGDVDFETFYFDQSFDDLVSFEIGTFGFAMDNLVFFDVIPEPSPFRLLYVGGALFCFIRRRN